MRPGHGRTLPTIIALLTASSLWAQQPIVPPPQPPIPQPNARGKATQHKITVRGCVQNGRLKTPQSLTGEVPFDILNVTEFILEGPKEMLRQIKEQHNGHYDELNGIATVPPPPQDEDAAVVSSKKGPVNITAGRRDEKSLGVRNAPQSIRLRVASLTHINEGCVARLR
jgi:hypothetical protein